MIKDVPKFVQQTECWVVEKKKKSTCFLSSWLCSFQLYLGIPQNHAFIHQLLQDHTGVTHPLILITTVQGRFLSKRNKCSAVTSGTWPWVYEGRGWWCCQRRWRCCFWGTPPGGWSQRPPGRHTQSGRTSAGSSQGSSSESAPRGQKEGWKAAASIMASMLH